MQGTDDGYAARFGLSRQEQQLLLLAGLTLIDGVFVSAVIGGVLSSPRDAISLGVNVFSGAGCLAISLALEGKVRQRIGAVLRVYGLYILPGAVLLMACLPVVQGLLLPHFEVFSALVIGGLALEFIGIQLAPRGPRPMTWAAQWLWSLRLATTPPVVLAVALSASLLHAAQARPALGSSATLAEVGLAALAVFAGLALTLVGAICGAKLERVLDPIWVRRGGAIGLVLIAVQILGGPVPEGAPICALGVGLGAGMLRQVWRGRRHKGTPTVATTDEGGTRWA